MCSPFPGHEPADRVRAPDTAAEGIGNLDRVFDSTSDNRRVWEFKIRVIVLRPISYPRLRRAPWIRV